MKVFMCQRKAVYSGGLAVVAANSVEEAFKTFFEDDNYCWMLSEWWDEDFNPTEDLTKWRSHYYPFEDWFECKELTANVDNPCVIMEDGYSE